MSAQFSGQLALLGPPRWVSSAGQTVLLDRKTAGILLYLVLNGAAPRERIARWFWPDSPDATARNNLVQLLRKLRRTLGQDLVTGTADLHLLQSVDADVTTVEEAFVLGRHEAFLSRYDVLLGSFEYDDCPDFEEWLWNARERHSDWKRQATTQATAAAEQRGDLRAALSWAEQRLRDDLACEEGYARVMRLQYRLGERSRALETYARCVGMLHEEFGAQPLDSTRKLAESIRQGAPLDDTPSPRAPGIPLSVLRPPVLIGREREWQRMNDAWSNGQGILLSGPAGIGKTRLMRDFASSHGATLLLEGRPGDRDIPFSTHARTLRQVLEAFPRTELPEWVRQEFARVLPELGEAPSTVLTEEAKLRFFEAEVWLYRHVAASAPLTVVFDDIHFTDAASIEAGAYMFATFWGDPNTNVRTVMALRPDELPPQLEEAMAHVVEAGQVVRLDIAPLPPREVASLLHSLGVPSAERASDQMSAYTGGNPVLILETLKHLYETGLMHEAWTEDLPVPRTVERLIGDRVARLSPSALQAARVAAVLRSDFTLDLVAAVLNTPIFDLMSAWEELEVAQIVVENRFSHDLLYEAVAESIPPEVRRLLHRSAARVLEQYPVNPAVAAQHWRASGDTNRVIPLLLKAAEWASRAYRVIEAAAFLEQAVDLLEAHERPSEAVRVLGELAELLEGHDHGERLRLVTVRMTALARTPAERAQASLCRCRYGYLNQLDTVEADALAGLDWARTANDTLTESKLLAEIGMALWKRLALEEASEAFTAACALAERLGNEKVLSAAHNNLGFIRSTQERLADALAHRRVALALAVRAGDKRQQATCSNNLGFNLIHAGLAREAAPLLAEAVRLLESSQEAYEFSRSLTFLSVASRDLGRYAEAIEHARRALDASSFKALPTGYIRRALASVHCLLGDDDGAEVELREADADPWITTIDRVANAVTRARMAARRGESTEAFVRQVEAWLTELPRRNFLAQAYAVHASVAPLDEALAYAKRALNITRERHLHGLIAECETRLANVYLNLGELDHAAVHSERATTSLTRYDPVDFCVADVLVTRARVLARRGDAASSDVTERVRAWLRVTSDEHVPQMHRQRFLDVHLASSVVPGV